MEGEAHSIRKKRKLIIGSEDEEEQEQPQSEVKSSVISEKKSDQPERIPLQITNKQSPKANTSNVTSDKSNANNQISKQREKIVRKEEERNKYTLEKKEEESDGHASDKDLFLPDDSNSEDLDIIRQKYGWKKSIPVQSAPPKKTVETPTKVHATSSTTKTNSSRVREEPQRKPKDALVYDVLKRWWYALPDWPPANYDYAPILEANKLRLYNKQKFRVAPDIDDKGYAKCYEILGYQGVFKDFNNKYFDLRPIENKPCYSNFIRKEVPELIELLKRGLKNQIESLEGSKVIDQNLLQLLQKQYAKVKDR